MNHDDVLILRGREVAGLLEDREAEVLDAVRKAYETHARGESSLPHSSFLRFPDSDVDRIISLPAYLGGDFETAGLKWIASVPSNLERGLERASAVVILNRRKTGRPQAVLEGSLISKQRTAASAALAAQVLRRDRAPRRVGFIGCGPINFEVARFLDSIWPQTASFCVFDLDPERAAAFRERLLERGSDAEVAIASSLDEALADSPLVSFATTAIEPHVSDLSVCPPGATILHVSLRDLSPEVILAHHNVVDDLDHVARARTSIHLAAERSGSTAFVHASLGEILLGRIPLPPAEDSRATIFSPFGLGVLDLAVARMVYDSARKLGHGTSIDSFF